MNQQKTHIGSEVAEMAKNNVKPDRERRVFQAMADFMRSKRPAVATEAKEQLW